MDQSWRLPPLRPPPPPPPIQGNNSICPICSISHFPFCPPPPPFFENPRFHHTQSQNDYYHERPPFVQHHPPPSSNHHISLNYNYNSYNPSDGGVGRRPTWYGSNPTFDMNPYDRVADDNNFNRSVVSASYFGYDGYDNGGFKRMKIESIDDKRDPRGSFLGGEIADSSRFSSDNERILKLIHDHGNAANAAPGGLPKVGEDLFPESNSENAGRYGHDRFGETREVTDDIRLKQRRGINDFPNADMGSFEREEPSLFPGNSREDFGVVYGRNNVHYDKKHELSQSQYDRIESFLSHSLDYSSHGREQGLPYNSVLQRSEPNQKLHMLPDVHDRRTDTSHENYHNLPRISLGNVALTKESSYSHPGQSQLPPPSDAMLLQQPNHNSQPPYNWSEPKSHYAPNSLGTSFGQVEVSHPYGGQPPLPASPPPPPPPMDPPRSHFFEPHASSLAKKPSLFPIAVSSSADSLSSRSAIPENQSSAQAYNAGHHASTLSSAEEFHTLQPSAKTQVRDVEAFPLYHMSTEKPNVIDASHIFKRPHRSSRPDHLVVILRGLPGSGKSYLAKVLRDIEVENGGEAPRIHSMDEYFMTEVEKAEDSELTKNSGSLRGKRQVMKKVMEYCYEPEMEEAYRASMLKAFKKTLDEGVYSFIIVDDRNLRVADFAQFWATAKRSGYEVYIVEAAYKDPAGCAARNVHNFTLDDIRKMSQQWEEAPSLYLKMDVKSLLHGDGFDESGIQEVDMDMEDDEDDALQRSDVKSPQDVTDPVDTFSPRDVDPVNDVKQPVETKEVKNHLSRSKWSNDLDGSESLVAEGGPQSASALSGLIQAYSKDGKSVHWGDQGGDVGFSISATRKATTRSLVIGPGSGYNLKSNPLSDEAARNGMDMEPKSQSVFQERIRAEQESFKAVFDKRRQRIGFHMDGDE